jgi:hypothetical protein
MVTFDCSDNPFSLLFAIYPFAMGPGSTLGMCTDVFSTAVASLPTESFAAAFALGVLIFASFAEAIHNLFKPHPVRLRIYLSIKFQ